MLILTNCLTEKADEGCIKVANSLIKRVVEKHPDTYVVSYERRSKLTNKYLELNKLLISGELYKLIKQRNEHVLYIPFPAKEWATALRVFLLSFACKKRLTIVLTMVCRCNFIGNVLFKLSGVHIVTFSESTKSIYEKMVGKDRVKYIKTGVDTNRFSPVSEDRVKELKHKYGFAANKPVILHVGHLKNGRNVAELMKFDSRYQVALVVSTLTKHEQDEALRNKLQRCENIKIFDEYLPNIEELYQLSDVYFFPVAEEGNCIDVPLSCMEAAACNKPILTTCYGEMATFEGKAGFWFIRSFDAESLDLLVASALEEKNVVVRSHVLEYDWKHAVEYFDGFV